MIPTCRTSLPNPPPDMLQLIDELIEFMNHHIEFLKKKIESLNNDLSAEQSPQDVCPTCTSFYSAIKDFFDRLEQCIQDLFSQKDSPQDLENLRNKCQSLHSKLSELKKYLEDNPSLNNDETQTFLGTLNSWNATINSKVKDIEKAIAEAIQPETPPETESLPAPGQHLNPSTPPGRGEHE